LSAARVDRRRAFEHSGRDFFILTRRWLGGVSIVSERVSPALAAAGRAGVFVHAVRPGAIAADLPERRARRDEFAEPFERSAAGVELFGPRLALEEIVELIGSRSHGLRRTEFIPFQRVGRRRTEFIPFPAVAIVSSAVHSVRRVWLVDRLSPFRWAKARSLVERKATM
jgi:hypothetical protein